MSFFDYSLNLRIYILLVQIILSMFQLFSLNFNNIRNQKWKKDERNNNRQYIQTNKYGDENINSTFKFM